MATGSYIFRGVRGRRVACRALHPAVDGAVHPRLCRGGAAGGACARARPPRLAAKRGLRAADRRDAGTHRLSCRRAHRARRGGRDGLCPRSSSPDAVRRPQSAHMGGARVRVRLLRAGRGVRLPANGAGLFRPGLLLPAGKAVEAASRSCGPHGAGYARHAFVHRHGGHRKLLHLGFVPAHHGLCFRPAPRKPAPPHGRGGARPEGKLRRPSARTAHPHAHDVF